MVEETYAPIVFQSQAEEDNLKRIEIIGVPREPSGDGNQTVSTNAYNFFEMFVATELFKENKLLSQYSFEFIKIWVYNTSEAANAQGYSLPRGESSALKLFSKREDSELKYISVLDIGLSGNQKVLWEKGCKELLTPLFRKFVPPAEPPDVMKDYLRMRFGKRLADKMDLYLHMRKNMCFDALIVEAK